MCLKVYMSVQTADIVVILSPYQFCFYSPSSSWSSSFAVVGTCLTFISSSMRLLDTDVSCLSYVEFLFTVGMARDDAETVRLLAAAASVVVVGVTMATLWTLPYVYYFLRNKLLLLLLELEMAICTLFFVGVAVNAADGDLSRPVPCCYCLYCEAEDASFRLFRWSESIVVLMR